MPTQTTSVSRIEQLPEAARDRINQLRLLFIERSRGHLSEFMRAMDERKSAIEPGASDPELIKLAHSLVGASGIFGFQTLGNAALEVETILRQTRYSEADFDRVMAGLISQLKTLE